ncbi:MAG: hypothetical protein AAFQ77_01480 [Myxococcota bacterium]
MSPGYEGTLEVLDYSELCTQNEKAKSTLHFSHEGPVLWAKGDLKISGHLGLDRGVEIPGRNDNETRPVGLWVSGDLSVRGSIINGNGDYGAFLGVEGSTRSDHIVGGGGEIVLLGPTHAKGIVLGHYNHGRLYIYTSLTARFVLSDDHDLWIPKDFVGVYLDEDGEFTPEDYPSIFRPEYLEVERYDEEELEVSLKYGDLLDAIIEGRELFQSSVPAISERLLESDDRITGLLANYDGKGLAALPPALADDQRITGVDLTDCSFEEVPSILSKFKTLELLDISGNPLEALPSAAIHPALHALIAFDQERVSLQSMAAFAALHPKLRALSYSPKYASTRNLDDTLELAKAASKAAVNPIRMLLSKTARQEARSAREEFLELLGEQSEFPAESIDTQIWPASLGRLAEVTVLDTHLASIDFSAPVKTKSLSLAGSVHGLRATPRWTACTELVRLDLSLRSTWRAREQNLSLLASLDQLPERLEHLLLNHWWAIDPAMVRRIGEFPPRLGHLKNLKTLSLIRTPVNVTALIAVIRKFRDLREIHIDGQTLTLWQRAQLKRALPPSCKIIS